VLDNLPFGDDFRFIFSKNHITQAPNPFLYFFPWSIYYKSWALSYAMLWAIYKIFGEQFVYYRMINISLHFINHLFFRKIIQKHYDLSPEKQNLFSLIFLLHPLSVLTTSWIFQIKTLLAVMFFLISYNFLINSDFQKKRDYLKLNLLFWMSLASKVCGILFPIYLFIVNRKKMTKKKLTLLVTPLLCISLLYGALNIKGITHIIQENIHIKSMNKDKSKNVLISNSQLMANKIKYDHAIKQPGGITFDINVSKDISKGMGIYFNPFFKLDHLIAKYVISIQNLGKAVMSSLALYNYFPFYETNTQTATSPYLFVYIVVGMTSIIALFLLKNHFLTLAFILFLPISGLFYIPYMKFSYSSDHWFYPFMLFFLLGMIKYSKNKNWLIISLFVITFSNYIFTIYKYRSFPELLALNLKTHKNAIIVEHQSQYDMLEKDWYKVFGKYTFLLNNVDFTSPSYGNKIFEMTLKLRVPKLVEPYYPTMAKMILEQKNFQLLKSFNLNLSGIVQDRTLDLTESLDAIYSHRIDDHTYKKTIEYLE